MIVITMMTSRWELDGGLLIGNDSQCNDDKFMCISFQDKRCKDLKLTSRLDK